MKYDINQVRNHELNIKQLEEYIFELNEKLLEPEIPKELYKQCFALNKYEIDDKLKTFDIIHIYSSKDICFPNGYFDSRWMDVHIFNSNSMKKRILETKDGIQFADLKEYKLYIIRTYLDGSVLIRFNEFLNVNIYQNIYINKMED